jgi:hypothetical protein
MTRWRALQFASLLLVTTSCDLHSSPPFPRLMNNVETRSKNTFNFEEDGNKYIALVIA